MQKLSLLSLTLLLASCHGAKLSVTLLPEPSEDPEVLERWTWDLDRLQEEGRELERMPAHDEAAVLELATTLGMELEDSDPSRVELNGSAGDVVAAVIWGADGDGRPASWILLAARDPWGDEIFALTRPFGSHDLATQSHTFVMLSDHGRHEFFGLLLWDRWKFESYFEMTPAPPPSSESSAVPSP